MATSEEKTELVETLKGPRYYRILIQGYGGESAYMSISKEAHDFWKDITDEYGDSDLVTYMISDDDEEPDYEDIDSVPDEAKFLNDPDDENYKRPWYESHTEYEHSYGGTYDACYIDVDEIESGEYTAKTVNEVISRMDVTELVDEIREETEWELEATEVDEYYAGEDVEYIAQMYSSEKGCFFEGIVETVGSFDPKKLVFRIGEFDNGEETIIGIEYDGVEVDNQGGDTNGKGYFATVWKN